RTMDLVINDRGEVVSSRGTTQLPYLLGNLAQLVLPTLPKEAEQTWKQSREFNISFAESRFPRSPLRGDDSTVIKATQETTWKVEKVDGDTVVLSKKMEIRTAEMVTGKPRLEVQGEGKLTFNTKIGAPSKLEMEQK